MRLHHPDTGAVLRCEPDGSRLEVVHVGLRNPQELAFDDYGNLFTGDNNGDGGDAARIVYVVEGGDSGWAMPYQTLVGDYVRGQWNAEKLWHLAHETQPAWIVPPVAHLANGPSGLAAYPGLGLPERYAGHFFLCDYRYQPNRSQIWSFAVEPEGAGFRMVDDHAFVGQLLVTDVAFGYDGRIPFFQEAETRWDGRCPMNPEPCRAHSGTRAASCSSGKAGSTGRSTGFTGSTTTISFPPASTKS